MSDFKLQFLNNEAEEDEGLGHAGIETFKDAPYASIARECGQNSSDARLSEPVELNFDLLNIEASAIPDIDQFKDTVKSCLKKANQSEEEKNIDFFKNAEKLINAEKIKILRISDTNTKGLRGPCSPGTPFHSLVKATGVSNKEQDTSGGSFGIGKNAVYAVSDLQTVFYSTIYMCNQTKEEKFLAQGKSILISHQDQNEKPKKATGYWGEKDFKPVSSKEDCPEWLTREEHGTSIFALGFRDMKGWQYRIAASLITNFFTAIHRGEMVFNVDNGNIKIDSSALLSLFKDQEIRSAAASTGKLEDFEFSENLYDCLTSEEAKAKIIQIKDLGDISIRLLVRDDLPKRLSIIRNGMLITDSLENFGDKFKSFPMYRDFVAIIEPLEDYGSGLIKRLENPRHDGLSAERLSDESKRANATRTMKALAKAIRQYIRENTQVETKENTAIDELSEFFADQNKIEKIPEADHDTDPENFTYEPKKRKRKRVKVDLPTGGTEGGAGGITGEGGGDGNGVGSGDGAGKGGKGTKGSRVAVQLDDERNIFSDKGDLGKRRIFFTPAETGIITVFINAPGIASTEEIAIGETSKGEVVNGHIKLEITAGVREAIDIKFNTEYDGPIDVIGLMEEKGAAEDAA